MEKNKMKHIETVVDQWEDIDENLNCTDCATSCQSACKTSCTIGNIPCDIRKERYPQRS